MIIPAEILRDHSFILDENKQRFQDDWDLRIKIKSSYGERLELPDCFNVPFWRYYADRHNVSLLFYKSTKVLQPYIINKPTLICYSGGVESSLTKLALSNADILQIDERDCRVPYCMEGSLPLVGASMGYAVTFLGIESYTVSKSSFYKDETEDKDLTNIELRDEFKNKLNEYIYPAQFQSLVSIWDRAELVEKAFKLGLDLSSCLKGKRGTFCGDCYKCWSIYVCLKYKGITPPFKMSYKTAKKYIKEFDDYMEKGIDIYYSNGTFVEMLDNGFDVRDPKNYDG